MARKQNIHTVTHEGQAFKRTSATRTYQFLVVGKRSYLDALSCAGRMDKTDGDNYDYWQRREPAKVDGFVSSEASQAHRRLKRLKAVEAAKEAGEYARLVSIDLFTPMSLQEKRDYNPTQFST